MKTYILVSFCLGIFGFILTGLVMTVSSYPRKLSKSLGSDLFTLAIQMGFTLWAAWLLWAR